MITPDQLAKSGTEHGAQAALFCWSHNNIQQYPQLKWLFAVPNGFFGSAGQKGKMKAEGLKNGVPDIWLPVAKYMYREFTHCGLVIELKVGKGKLSIEQSEWLSHLNSQGYCTHVCYGWENARDRIVEYLS